MLSTSSLGGVLRSIGHGVSAAPIVSSPPILSVADARTGTSVILTLTAPSDVGYVTSRLYRRTVNTNFILVTTYVSGNYQDTGLTQYTKYWYVAIPLDGGNVPGPPSNVVDVVPIGVAAPEPMGDYEGVLTHIRTFLRDDQWPNWWRRRSGAGFPPDVLNLSYARTSNDNFLDHPNIKVADDPDLWQNLGPVPCLIRDVTGLSVGKRRMFEELSATHRGTIPFNYEVIPGDHFEDYVSQEYRCVRVISSASRQIRTLALQLLPGSTVTVPT